MGALKDLENLDAIIEAYIEYIADREMCRGVIDWGSADDLYEVIERAITEKGINIELKIAEIVARLEVEEKEYEEDDSASN